MYKLVAKMNVLGVPLTSGSHSFKAWALVVFKSVSSSLLDSAFMIPLSEEREWAEWNRIKQKGRCLVTPSSDPVPTSTPSIPLTKTWSLAVFPSASLVFLLSGN
jgi:hypothetical protein